MANDPSNNPIDASQGVQATGNAAQQSATQLNAYNQAVVAAQTGTESYGNAANVVGRILSDFNGQLKNASNYFQDNSRVTQAAINTYNILGVSVLGVSKAFAGLNDNSGVTNFSAQLSGLIDAATQSTNPLMALTKLAKTFGSDLIPKGAFQSVEALGAALKGAAVNIGQAADEALKFSNVNYQLLASSGQLNDIWAKGKDGLAQLNDKLQDQSKMITATYGATGVLLPTLGKYYEQLGQIPGALTKVVSAGGDASQQVSLFQAAVQMAGGTGRDFQAIVNDMSTAFENYGETGNAALLFTARMTEQANNFGISVADTKGFMDSMSGAFKMLGDNAEGTSKIFSEFFGRLRDTGLGVKPSMEIMEQMTGAMSKMSVAQEAFLSRRSGGPGGLLGAVQIEKDIRDGKSDEVFAKARASFTQAAGGKVMTQENVKTQSDAAQFEKQRQMLMSGAFGGMSANKDQATRMLEIFAKGPEQGKFKEGGELLKETMQMGANVEQKSLTQLIDANKHLEEIKQQGGMTALKFAQQAFTSASGNQDITNQIDSAVAEATEQGASASGQQGGTDKSQLYSSQAFSGILGDVGKVGTGVGSAIQTGKNMFEGKDTNKMDAVYQGLEKLKEQQKQQLSSGEISKEMYARTMHQITMKEGEALGSRGKMVGTAAAHSAGAGGTAHPGAHPGGAAGSGARTAGSNKPDNINLTVNVNVDGKKLMQSNQNVALHGQPINQ